MRTTNLCPPRESVACFSARANLHWRAGEIRRTHLYLELLYCPLRLHVTQSRLQVAGNSRLVLAHAPESPGQPAVGTARSLPCPGPTLRYCVLASSGCRWRGQPSPCSLASGAERKEACPSQWVLGETSGRASFWFGTRPSVSSVAAREEHAGWSDLN